LTTYEQSAKAIKILFVFKQNLISGWLKYNGETSR
jgi:hypothetical protein